MRNSEQRKAVLNYLKTRTATAAMIAEATGVPHKNICRYKWELEKSGQLRETEQRLCEATGYRAWYLTIN